MYRILVAAILRSAGRASVSEKPGYFLLHRDIVFECMKGKHTHMRLFPISAFVMLLAAGAFGYPPEHGPFEESRKPKTVTLNE